MFVRPCWGPQDSEEMYRVIDNGVWSLLITSGELGPHATNLPLLLDRQRGPHGVLVGHIARANRHARALVDSDVVHLAVFHGPSTYVSPTWYPRRDMPGTFYYSAVHCYGRIRVHSDAELERSLSTLSDRMEEAVPDPWRTSEIPHSEITRRLPAIMGFDMAIDRIEGKFKLGQDEPKRDAMAVASRLASSDNPSDRALALAIRRANQDRPDDESA